ncbi:hypothetical protein [Phytohabitans rumicis]|uniref:Uncharacterized protein n=1 Tax=Phytohabitans rumicis TaxID=1076125 RepID=A0A6V8LK50_9ACTN|nr:hypothetical protein [Phytohabitans rumicis]GFJ92995.1 hypothetical protein Prum_066370 [Phytohabitans rumicis]
MLELLIIAAIAIANIAAAVYIVFLTITEIVSWFRNNRRLSQNDTREVGFTLQKRLANGDYNTIQGVFNQSTNEIAAIREVNSSSVDGDLARNHQGNDLAIYT